MSTTSNTYTLDELDELEEEAASATAKHLNSAREYIFELMEQTNVEGAVMGGFSLFMRGSNRQTVDVDIFFGGTMSQLQSMVRNQTRLKRPGFLCADVMRLFVRCGGQWDRIVGREQFAEIDLLPAGGGLASAGMTTEIITYESKPVPVLDIASMIRSKVKSFDARASESDLHDLMWMLSQYEDVALQCRDHIDYALRECVLEGYVELHGDKGPQFDQLKMVLDVTWPLND